ncbi:MAG TPA: DMT family transporter [Gaiellaceae bacterium]
MRRLARADVMLSATVLLWALNITVTKYVLTHGFKPLAYSSIRYGGAALPFGALTYRREGSLRVGRGSIPFLVLAGVVGILLNQLSYMYAVKLTTATTVALILGTTPAFAGLFASAVGLETLAAPFWVASLVSFGGVALVAVGSSGGLSGNLGGDLLGVATAATWAGYSVVIAPLMRTYSPFRISAIALLLGWIPLAAIGSHQLATQDFGSVPPLLWVCLGYAVLGPLVTTNVLWFTSIDRVGPSRATLFANMQPFVGAIFALLLLSERITVLQVLGGAAIAAGIALPRLWRRRSVPVAEPA